MKIAILWLSCLFLGLLVLFAPVSKAQVVNEAIVSRFSDINFQIWGNTLTKPIFLDNADFNDEDTPLEIIGDTGGIYRDHAIAQMVELGFSGGGENWTFLAVLEAEFILDKDNIDRTRDTGADGGLDFMAGQYGDQFGVEFLEVSYDFTSHGMPLALETGWTPKPLDNATGVWSTWITIPLSALPVL